MPVLVRIPIGRLVLIPRETSEDARVRLFIAALDDSDGGTSDVQQATVPISVPKADLAAAQGKQYVYSVTLLMRGASQRVSIGVRDDVGAQASFLSRGLRVGGSLTPADGGSETEGRNAGWIDLFRSLGEALLEVWRAELGTLQDDLQRSGRHLGVALGLFGAAAVLLFWIVGLVLFVLVSLLHVWLPWWGASLVVLALFVIAAAILARFGLGRDAQGGEPARDRAAAGGQPLRLVAARPARPSEDSGRRARRRGSGRRGEPLGRELP